MFVTDGRLFTFNASTNNVSLLTGRTSDHEYMSVSKKGGATICWQISFAVYIKYIKRGY